MVRVRKCASCPALTVPSGDFVRFVMSNAPEAGNVIRGWQAFDGRWYCVLCVVSGGLYARREQ